MKSTIAFAFDSTEIAELIPRTYPEAGSYIKDMVFVDFKTNRSELSVLSVGIWVEPKDLPRAAGMFRRIAEALESRILPETIHLDAAKPLAASA